MEIIALPKHNKEQAMQPPRKRKRKELKPWNSFLSSSIKLMGRIRSGILRNKILQEEDWSGAKKHPTAKIIKRRTGSNRTFGNGLSNFQSDRKQAYRKKRTTDSVMKPAGRNRLRIKSDPRR